MMNKVLLNIVLCTITFTVMAQKPEIVKVASVSFIPNTTKYQMRIDASADQVNLIDHYEVFRWRGTYSQQGLPEYEGTPLENLSTSADIRIYEFEGLAEDTSVVYYKVLAIGKNGQKSDWDLEPKISDPSNIFLHHDYDSCNEQITFTWNEFFPWETSPVTYKLYNGIDLSPRDLHSNNNNTSITFTLSELGIISNVNYHFYLELTNGLTSDVCRTNIISFKTVVEPAPDTINADGTVVYGNNVKLSFTSDTLTKKNKYFILKSSSKQSEYKVIDTVLAENNNITVYDNNLDSLDKVQYLYKAQLVSNCDPPLGLLESNIESTIPFTAKVNDNGYAELSWVNYQRFASGDWFYQVKRFRGDDTISLSSTDKGTKQNDNLGLLDNKVPGEKICYCVEAIEQDNPSGINGYARSNIACIYLKTVIKMPGFLALGKDCKSRSSVPFQFPANAYTPSSFQMVIFDRWGTKIFESNKSDEGWDGTYKNGNVVPIGGYIYYVKYPDAEGRIVEQRGSFVVVCASK